MLCDPHEASCESQEGTESERQWLETVCESLGKSAFRRQFVTAKLTYPANRKRDLAERRRLIRDQPDSTNPENTF